MKLNLNAITKQYNDKTAVDGVSLKLTPGVWGLLGANGAGKTTLMRIITGILSPTSGQVTYDDINILDLGETYRDILGYLPQTFGFYPEFTVIDYLYYIAAIKGIPKASAKDRIESMLDTMGLSEVRKKQIRKLSGGMQRRVGIAQALLNDPKILILDEPTSGLDPGERVYFRNILSEYAQNRIVLISTHIVADIEYISAQNAIMKDGKIIAANTTSKLLEDIQGMVWQTTVAYEQLEAISAKVCIVNVKNEENGAVHIRYVSKSPISSNSEQIPPHLEDLYLWIFRDNTSKRSMHL